MGDRKRFARQSVQVIAGKRFARRKCDRVQQAVEAAPFAAQGLEQCSDIVVARNVAAQNGRTAELRRELSHALMQVVVDIGKGECRAFALAGLRDSICDRAAGKQPGDQNPAIA